MKVLIAGEASVHLQNYCTAIHPYLDEMTVLTEFDFNLDENIRQFEISFRSVNPLKLVLQYNKLKNLLKKLRPELIHVHQVNRLAFFISLAANELKIPLITTAWGSDVLIVPQKNLLYRYLVSRVLKTSQIVTADARVMIEAMQLITPDIAKYVLLQYGIDPIIPALKENIIFSNRLHKPLYNIDQIIKDFALFYGKHKDWRLVIGASGTETENLRKLCFDLGIADVVEFVGWLSKEQNAFQYARASIFVSIPSSDGTSVSLLEAISANCIPVVSDLPVSKEWIIDGVNGVIRKKDKNSYEEALYIDKLRCFTYNIENVIPKVSRQNCISVFLKIYIDTLKIK